MDTTCTFLGLLSNLCKLLTECFPFETHTKQFLADSDSVHSASGGASLTSNNS